MLTSALRSSFLARESDASRATCSTSSHTPLLFLHRQLPKQRHRLTAGTRPAVALGKVRPVVDGDGTCVPGVPVTRQMLPQEGQGRDIALEGLNMQPAPHGNVAFGPTAPHGGSEGRLFLGPPVERPRFHGQNPGSSCISAL